MADLVIAVQLLGDSGSLTGAAGQAVVSVKGFEDAVRRTAAPLTDAQRNVRSLQSELAALKAPADAERIRSQIDAIKNGAAQADPPLKTLKAELAALKAPAEADRIRQQIQAIKSGADDAAKSVGAFGRSFPELLRYAGQFAGFGVGFSAAQAGINALRGAFQATIGTGLALNAQLQTTTLQFESLGLNAGEARKHVADLFQFAKATPFDTASTIEASRALRTMGGAALDTQDNLRLVGDAAASVSAPIQEVSFWVGRAYSSIQAGRPFGEAAQRLQELGILSGTARNRLEDLQKSGASSTQVWGVFAEALARSRGAMARQAETLEGLTSTFADQIALLSATATAPLFQGESSGLKALIDLLSSPEAQQGAEEIARSIRDVGTVAGAAISPVRALAAAFRDAGAGSSELFAALRVLNPALQALDAVHAGAEGIRAVAAGMDQEAAATERLAAARSALYGLRTQATPGGAQLAADTDQQAAAFHNLSLALHGETDEMLAAALADKAKAASSKEAAAAEEAYSKVLAARAASQDEAIDATERARFGNLQYALSNDAAAESEGRRLILLSDVARGLQGVIDAEAALAAKRAGQAAADVLFKEDPQARQIAQALASAARGERDALAAELQRAVPGLDVGAILARVQADTAVQTADAIRQIEANRRQAELNVADAAREAQQAATVAGRLAGQQLAQTGQDGRAAGAAIAAGMNQATAATNGTTAAVGALNDALQQQLDYEKRARAYLTPGSPGGAYQGAGTRIPDLHAPIPGFRHGGIVPGPIGRPMLAVVHGGETVSRAGSGGGVTINMPITVTGNHVTDSASEDRLARKTAERVRGEIRALYDREVGMGNRAAGPIGAR